MAFLEAIESSALAQLIIGSIWGFPIAEVAHLCFITVVFGSMVLMDLRLLGFMKAYPVAMLMDLLLKSVWMSFIGATITGALLFTTMASSYVRDLAFIVKMILLLLAACNALFMHQVAIKRMAFQSEQGMTTTPLIVKISAGFSLSLWVGILACGRLIAYFYPY